MRGRLSAVLSSEAVLDVSVVALRGPILAAEGLALRSLHFGSGKLRWHPARDLKPASRLLEFPIRFIHRGRAKAGAQLTMERRLRRGLRSFPRLPLQAHCPPKAVVSVRAIYPARTLRRARDGTRLAARLVERGVECFGEKISYRRRVQGSP